VNDIQFYAERYIESFSEKDFKILYNRLLPGIRKYINPFIAGFTDNTCDMENEIISHTFEKVYTKIHQYNPQFKFSTWVYSIAKYAAWSETRRVKKLIFLGNCKSESGEVLDPLALTDVMNKENYESILDIEEREQQMLKTELYKKAVDEMLKEKYQSTNMKYNELAEKYNIPLNTVKSRIRCARQKVRKKIKNFKEYMED